MAGVTFEAGEGGGIGDLIRLRGFSARGDMYVDGLRDIAQYNRDNFNLDRLEVLRGSASMLYGRGSTGGIINQASKLPQLMNEGEIAVTAGTAEYFRSTADVNLKTGDDAALRVNAMLIDAKSTRNGPETHRLGIAPSYRFGIGTADEFLVGLYHLEYHDIPDYGFRWFQGRPVDAAANRWYGTASDYQNDTADIVTLQHIHRFVGGGELKATLRDGRYRRDLWFTSAGFATPLPASIGDVVDSTSISRGSQTRGANDRHRFLASDYSGKFSPLGLRHDVLAGAELASENTFVWSYTGTPAKPDTTWGDAGGTGALVDTRVRTPQTDFDADYASLAFTPQVRWNRRDALWSKRLGVLWQPSAFSSYYAWFGTSFNTTGDLCQFGVNGATDAARQAAAQRSATTPPEESRNVEIGAKWDLLDGNLSLRSAIFRTHKFHERNTDATTADAQPLLSNGRHTDGVEFEAIGRPNAALELFASVALMKGRIDAAAPNLVGTPNDPTGLEPGLTPRVSGSVWANWRITPKWRVGFGIDGRSKTKPALAETGVNVAPGYVKADAMVEVEMAPMTFKLNLINLTDKVYADGIYRGFTVPGATRSAQVTVTTKL